MGNLEKAAFDLAQKNNSQIGDLSLNKADKTALTPKADKTYVDVELGKKANQSDLQNISKGSPKGVYATLSALQTALPTGDSNIYVVTADGKWYYWNGTAWVSGGVYQATSIADRTVSVDKTDFLKKGKNLFNKNTITENNYVNPTNGTLVSVTTSDSSDFIEIKPNTSYVKNAKGHIAFYDKDRVFISGITENTAVANYSFVSPANAKMLRMSMKKSEGYTAEKTQLEEGSSSTPYEAFTLYKVDYDALPVNDIFEKDAYKKALTISSSTEYASKTKNVFGDYRLLTSGDTSTLPVGSIVTRVPHSKMDFFLGLNELRLKFTSTSSNQGLKIKFNNYDIVTNGHSVGDYIQYGFLIDINPSTFNYYDLSLSYGTASRTVIDLNNGWYYVYGHHQVTQDDLTNQIKIAELRLLSASSSINYDFGVVCPIVIVSNKLIDLFSFLNKNIIPYNSKYNNLIWNSLGDSITAAGSYQRKVQNKLGFSSVRNYGVSGTTLADNGNSNAFVNRYMNMDLAADVITVLGGTNDYGQNIPLGDNSTYDKTTYKGALRNIIEGLTSMYKTKKIVFLTPPPRFHQDQESSNWKNTLGLHVRDYADAVISICGDYSIPVVDLSRNVGINQFNHDALLADRVHPNDLGYEKIADLIVGKLKTI